jgi:hypothetical protein
MMSTVAAVIVLICTFGGAMLGMAIRSRLPESHLDKESKEVIGVATGLLAALAALVMGLLVASAKAEFDAQEAGFEELAANIVLLDSMLAHYGPETADARAALKRAVATMIERIFPDEHRDAAGMKSTEITKQVNHVFAAIRNLAPKDDAQRAVQVQMLETSADMARTRWLLSEEHDTASLLPFVVVMIIWLTVIFGSFGLFAPRNASVIATLLACSLSTAIAVLLIVDLNWPASGIIQITSAPLRFAESQLGQ